MTSSDLRRWIAGFEAAERAGIDARRRAGPHPGQSIALALSLLNAARRAAGDRSLIDSRRDAEDEIVRGVWHRLRTRLQS